jgi:hypothetical protein
MESIIDPPTPPTIAVHAVTSGQPSIIAIKAMKPPPAMDAINPSTVTPPEVPCGTRFIVTMLRGTERESVPISVDHVSAVDAASAPAAAVCAKVE